MLKRVRIENYRCFREVDVPLRPLTVLIGENNTGKSTFLRAVENLINLRSELDSWLPFGELDVRPQLKGTIKGGKTFQARPDVETDPASGNGVDAEELRRRHHEFEVNNLSLAERLRPTELIRLSPGSIEMTCQGAADKHGAPRLGGRGENLPAYLDYLLRTNLKQFDKYKRRLRKLANGVEDLLITHPTATERSIRLVVDGGFKLDGDQASDGLQILMFVIALSTHPQPPKVLLIEEPEIGIHPERLHEVMLLLKGMTQKRSGHERSQVILTTHSPYLLDEVNPDQDGVLVFRRSADGARTVHALRENLWKHYQSGFGMGEVWSNLGEEGLVDG